MMTLTTQDRPAYWLIIAALLVLPIEQVKLPFETRLFDLVFIPLALYFVVFFLRSHRHIKFPLLAPLTFIVVASLLSTIAGLQHQNSLIAIIQELYLYIAFMVLANVLSAHSVSAMNGLLKAWSLVAAAEAVATTMGMLRVGPALFYTAPAGDEAVSSDNLIRGLGTYNNPNAAAVYLTISLFASLAAPFPIYLRFAISSLIFVGIVATGSLAGIFGAVISLLFLIVAHYFTSRSSADAFRSRVLVTATILCVLAIGVAILPFYPAQTSTASQEGDLSHITTGRLDRSLQGRIALIADGASRYQEYPLGTGPNTAILYVKTLHNDYAAFLFERGPLGLVGWLWLVGVALSTSLRTANEQTGKSRRWQMFSLAAAVFGCSLIAFSHQIFHFRQVWVLLAFVFGAQLADRARSTGEPDYS